METRLSCFGLFKIQSKIEDHLNRSSWNSILVVAVNVPLKLLAFAKYLVPSLLKGHLHVLPRCRSDVIPECRLLAVSLVPNGVFCSDRSPLGIGDVLLAHRLGEFVRATIYHHRRLGLP